MSVNKFKSTIIGGSLSVVDLETTTASFSCFGNCTISGNLNITGTTTGINKGMIGLENVDNTTDLNKPISTATQTALDLKANDNNVVKTSTNQTISGTKSFNATINANGNLRLNGSTSSITFSDGGIEYEITKTELNQLNNTLAIDNNVLKLSGNQTATGTKTFSNIIVNQTMSTNTTRTKHLRYQNWVTTASNFVLNEDTTLYVITNSSLNITATLPILTVIGGIYEIRITTGITFTLSLSSGVTLYDLNNNVFNSSTPKTYGTRRSIRFIYTDVDTVYILSEN